MRTMRNVLEYLHTGEFFFDWLQKNIRFLIYNFWTPVGKKTITQYHCNILFEGSLVSRKSQRVPSEGFDVG